jgi:hypothetical protein
VTDVKEERQIDKRHIERHKNWELKKARKKDLSKKDRDT